MGSALGLPSLNLPDHGPDQVVEVAGEIGIVTPRSNPTDKCPAFVVNPKIARWALEKQRTDELEYAQLLEDNVPADPIYSGLDGGMNKVFLARFPGRVTFSKVPPYALTTCRNCSPIPWVYNDGSLTSKLFGTLF